MKCESQKVKIGGSTVAVITVPEYDSVDEAIKAEGAESVLSLFNSQNRTNMMNSAREKARQVVEGKITKSALRDKALTRLFADPARAQSLAGQGEDVIQKALAEIEAEIEAEIKLEAAQRKSELSSQAELASVGAADDLDEGKSLE